jgi:hypothetical protein
MKYCTYCGSFFFCSGFASPPFLVLSSTMPGLAGLCPSFVTTARTHVARQSHFEQQHSRNKQFTHFGGSDLVIVIGCQLVFVRRFDDACCTSRLSSPCDHVTCDPSHSSLPNVCVKVRARKNFYVRRLEDLVNNIERRGVSGTEGRALFASTKDFARDPRTDN